MFRTSILFVDSIHTKKLRQSLGLASSMIILTRECYVLSVYIEYIIVLVK